MNITNAGMLAIALSVAACATNARADSLPDGVQVHGFASQALIGTDNNNFFGDTQNDASLDFTELGANISWRINPRIQLSAQAVSRRAGKTDDGSPRLDYATLDYTIHASEDARYGLYLGKIKNPYGLYNEIRDVAFTRPSILLPQSIYLDRARNFVLSSPGVAVYGDKTLATGNLSYQFGIIRPDTSDKETESVFLSYDRPGQIKSGTGYIGRVLLEQNNGQVNLALTGVSIRTHYRPGVADSLQAGNIGLDSWVISGQYNAEHWVLTTEYAQNRVTENIFGTFFQNGSVTGSSYYVQGSYAFTQKWSAMARYDVTYKDKNDKNGKAFSALTGVPTHSRFARDLTVGLSYNLNNNWLLRGEFHKVDGTAWLPYTDNPNLFVTTRHWNMWLFQAAFRF